MNILFLQKRVLFPADTGGKIRSLNIVRYLARWHRVTYVCNLQPGEESAAEQMQALGLTLVTVPWNEAPRGSGRFYRDVFLNLFSRYPFNVDKDFDPALRHTAETLVASNAYDVLICDFVQMARNAIGLRGPRTVLFTHNVEAQIFARQAVHERRWALRQLLSLQARRMRRFEAGAGRAFDAVVAVSPRDKQTFEEWYGWRHVRTVDTAVDTEYFRPVEGPERPASLVFVGSLDWAPNQDGIRSFIEQVWPLIRARQPAAEFRIVGRNPSREVQAFSAVPGVEVVGTVDDIRPYMAAATVVVVPLRVGGGTRLKLFEAMAMRKAVVSTSLGAEGLPVTPGTDLLIADAPQDFARAVIQLLEDAGLRARLANAAYGLVQERFRAEIVARQFEGVCQEMV